MGFVSATFTLMIGYFTIDFIKKNKKTLKDMPIINDFIDIDEKETISNDVYLIVFAFVLKDFIF